MNRFNEPAPRPPRLFRAHGPPGARRQLHGGQGLHRSGDRFLDLEATVAESTCEHAIGRLQPVHRSPSRWRELCAYLVKIKALATQWLLVFGNRFTGRMKSRSPPTHVVGWLRRKPPSFVTDDDPWL